jgi:photosystem II stability/assembly factor-like uncharacterized protein
MQQASGTTSTLRGVQAVTSAAVWIVGKDDVILRTTDSGTNWQRLPSVSATQVSKIKMM